MAWRPATYSMYDQCIITIFCAMLVWQEHTEGRELDDAPYLA